MIENKCIKLITVDDIVSSVAAKQKTSVNLEKRKPLKIATIAFVPLRWRTFCYVLKARIVYGNLFIVSKD